MKNTIRSSLPPTIALFVAAGLAACAGATADLELDAARRAIAQAQEAKAADCAEELYRSAEASLDKANAANQDGDAEAAKAEAVNAENLARQALAASPPGCDEPKEEEPAPQPVAAESTDARTFRNLDQVLQPIYFDYNDASIREDSKETLSTVAEFLLNSPGVRIEVEGHCDVRGSTEYNLHLGERRAKAVERYLVTQGVGADQISIISYGEERPVDLATNEQAHQRNRRAELKSL